VGGSVVVGEYGVREVVMFLLKSLGGGVYSVKKLMKLVFLAQCDVEGRVVYECRYSGRPLARPTSTYGLTPARPSRRAFSRPRNSCEILIS
jgi:hypothetical protein